MEHLDVIILGGYYGEGRLRGGLVSQFLLGVAKPPATPGKITQTIVLRTIDLTLV